MKDKFWHSSKWRCILNDGVCLFHGSGKIKSKLSVWTDIGDDISPFLVYPFSTWLLRAPTWFVLHLSSNFSPRMYKWMCYLNSLFSLRSCSMISAGLYSFWKSSMNLIFWRIDVLSYCRRTSDESNFGWKDSSLFSFLRIGMIHTFPAG